MTVAMTVQLPPLKFVMALSFEPSRVNANGSRSGASLADCRAIPVTWVEPTEGETMNPDGDEATLSAVKIEILLSADVDGIGDGFRPRASRGRWDDRVAGVE